MRHVRYLKIVLMHKLFVLIAGIVLRVPLWRLLVHDASKFSRAEWGPYMRRFVAGRAGVMDKDTDPDEWQVAWMHHWHRNTHHWEHWLRIKDDRVQSLRMPEANAREMVADWMGAGRAYTGSWDIRGWYAKNRERILLHPETRALVERLLELEK